MKTALDTAKINEYYNTLLELAEKYREIAQRFMQEQEIEHDYMNPFHTHELDNLIGEVKNRLIEFITDRYKKTYFPNVTVDMHELRNNFRNKRFNADEVAAFLSEKYITHAEKLSYAEILRNAQTLLPVFFNREKSNPEISDIVKKDTLVLRKYVSSYGAGSYYLYDLNAFSAIEKLIKIVLNNENPGNVTADKLLSVYWNKRDSELFLTYAIDDRNIKAVRLYRNGKLRIKLKSKEAAEKVL